MTTFEKIYQVVSNIPKGEITTYKKIAETLGIKNPRLVGFALHRNVDPKNIPCHRVVNSRGYLSKNYAFGGLKGQISKLEKEGISISSQGYVINFINYFYQPQNL